MRAIGYSLVVGSIVIVLITLYLCFTNLSNYLSWIGLGVSLLLVIVVELILLELRQSD